MAIADTLFDAEAGHAGEISDLIREIDDLKELLADCKVKLAHYREQHSGEYVGGVEYTEIMARIERAMGGG